MEQGTLIVIIACCFLVATWCKKQAFKVNIEIDKMQDECNQKVSLNNEKEDLII